MRAEQPTAVFLEKDGTLIDSELASSGPNKMKLYTDAIDGLRLLYAHHFDLIVVSNQPSVAFGTMSEKDLKLVENKLAELFDGIGVKLSGFYFCPHHPDGNVERYSHECLCRKPRPGLLYRAAADLGYDLKRSWAFGDTLHDIEAGNRAGCRTVLIDRGYETEWQYGNHRTPTFIVETINEAAQRVLQEDRHFPTATLPHLRDLF
jgi:D-glycero-D-manno-heptose 1,7-bisphosphate phosphatase